MLFVLPGALRVACLTDDNAGYGYLTPALCPFHALAQDILLGITVAPKVVGVGGALTYTVTL